MGLAGRKEKQRIPNDPRNLSWADDATKFGAAYLQKLGWSEGSGLGTNGEGRTSHIKVHHKLDMLGIGAAHQRDPNGIAWKQNKDFENLLRRLNNANGEEESDPHSPKIDGFAKATEPAATEAQTLEGVSEEPAKKKRKRGHQDVDAKRKKSKSRDDEDSDAEGVKEKKRKEKKEKKRSKDKGKGKADDADEPAVSAQEDATPAVQPIAVVPRPFRAHRARFLASKRLASKASTAIDEILGISRSATATPYPDTSIPSTPGDSSSSLTPLTSTDDDLKLQELKTSSKSVMDYFKEKLLAKSNAASFSNTPIPSSSTTPSSADDGEPDDYDDRPRGGLGLGFARASAGIGSSKLRAEVSFTQAEEEPVRRGLGMSKSMSAMFASASSKSVDGSETTVETKTVTVIEEIESGVASQSQGTQEKKKKKKKRDEDADGLEDDAELIVESEKKKKSKKHKSIELEVSHAVDEPTGKKKKRSKHIADNNVDATETVAERPSKSKKRKSRSSDQD